MIFRKEPRFRDSNNIVYLKKYHPYWNKLYHERNPLFDDFSRLILDLKGKDESVIHLFAEYLDKVLNDNIAISVVPPHDREGEDSGIKRLAGILAKNTRIDATDCLIRTVNTKPQAINGLKTKGLQRFSLAIKHIHKVRDKPVLILDDITTSGNSLNACKRLIELSRAKMVECLALGKTHRDSFVRVREKNKVH